MKWKKILSVFFSICFNESFCKVKNFIYFYFEWRRQRTLFIKVAKWGKAVRPLQYRVQ